MNILLVYATYSSGTETAAHQVKKWLEESQHQVTLKKAVDTDSPELTAFDLVVFASPSWWVHEKEGQPHIHMLELLEKSKDIIFNQKKCAVFGLGDTAYPHFCGAVKVIEEFVTTRGGNLINESLKVNNFPFEEEKNTQRLKEWTEKLKIQLY